MKIEEGKYYRTRDGRKVGPMVRWSMYAKHPFEITAGGDDDLIAAIWGEDGKGYPGSPDLIAEWTDQPEGTLAELDVKPGDVVECVYAHTDNFTTGKQYTSHESGHVVTDNGYSVHSTSSTFRLISRATQRDPEMTDPYGNNNGPVGARTDKPKTWGEMTDAEKGALLLAHHEGKVIQMVDCNGNWIDYIMFGAVTDYAYRIKPEPKHETVVLKFGGPYGVHGVAHDHVKPHRITFDLIDGEPDLISVKMERV